MVNYNKILYLSAYVQELYMENHSLPVKITTYISLLPIPYLHVWMHVVMKISHIDNLKFITMISETMHYLFYWLHMHTLLDYSKNVMYTVINQILRMIQFNIRNLELFIMYLNVALDNLYQKIT